MIRRIHLSRYTLLLAVLGLFAASLVIMPAASAEETPPADLFVVASDGGNAGVGGQWWTADSSITVEVFDGGGVLQTTVTTGTAPDPGSNYWWGVDTGITIYPGWTVTATGDTSGYSVTTEVTDVVVEGWDGECTVYGTTTYDPTNLRVDVYDPVNLSRYVTWTTDSSVPPVHSWTADFCAAPQAGESGDAVNYDLVAPSGQAIHHDGGLGATMYHYGEPAPEHRQLEVYREFNVVGAWESEQPLSLTVTRSGVEVYSSTAFYGFDLWQDGFELEVNDLVTVSDGDTTKEHVVRGQTVNELLADPDFPNRVTGTAEPNTDVSIRYNTIRSELSDDNIENATVTANASGDWSYDFVTDVVAGTAVEVTKRDSPETDNDSTVVVAYVPLPTITAHPPDFIVGEGWPVDASVSITVGEGFVVDPNPLPEQHGGFPWDTYFATGLYDETAQTGWVLEPDDVVTATNGVSEKVHIVTGLTVDGVDDATDIVFGHAQPSSEVQVALWGTESDPHVERVVSADATGNWYADFSTAIGPDEWQQVRNVTLETQGGAWQSDEDYDTTQIDFGPEGGGEEMPSIIASVWPDTYVRGWGWNGADLYITLDKTPSDTSDPLDWMLDLPVDTYEDGIWYNGWDFEVRAAFWDGSLTLDDGDVLTVTASGGGADGVVKTLIVVQPLTVTAVDRGEATVTGTAPIGASVTVSRWGDDVGHPHAEATVEATDGTWNAALPGMWAGSTGNAAIWDGDGDGTEAIWGASFIATGVANGVDGAGSVWGGYWYFDDSVTVEITRGSTAYDAIVVPVQDDWWHGLDTDSIGFDLQVDDVVTVTGDTSGTVNTHTVVALTVEWADWQEDGGGNTVHGTAGVPDGTVVRVEIHEYDAHRWTTVEGGVWSIDYDDPWEGQEEIRIDADMGGRVEVLDDVGNRTWAPWGTQGYGEPDTPRFSVETPYQVWGDGESWPVGAVVDLSIDDLSGGAPFTDSTQVVSMGSEPWEVGFRFDLAGSFEIQPGHVVTITSDFDGDTVLDVDRTLQVADIGEIDVNPVTGIVSGYVPPEAWVNVNGGNEFEGAWRDVQADGDGFFSANLSVAVGAGEEGDGTIGVPFPDGTGGSAQIFDDDGDSTHRGWCIGCDDGDDGGAFLQVYSTSTLPGSYDTVNANMAATAVLTIERDGDPNSPYTFDPTFADGGGVVFVVGDTLDILPGDLVTVSDENGEVSHVVTPLTVTEIDEENDTISGLARPNHSIYFNMYGWIEGEFENVIVERTLLTDSDGRWTVNVAQEGSQPDDWGTTDLGPGSWWQAYDTDPENPAQTTFDWWIEPWVAVVDNPQLIDGLPGFEGTPATVVHGEGWILHDFGRFSDVHVTVTDDDGETVFDGSATPLMPDEVAADQSIAEFFLYDVPLEPGYTVSATQSFGPFIPLGDIGWTREVTVTPLEVTNVNAITDVVTGISAVDASLIVFGDEANRIPDTSTGTWVADFGSGPASWDIDAGDIGYVVDTDADGDMHWAPWRAPTPLIGVAIHLDGESTIFGEGWLWNTLVTLTVTDPGEEDPVVTMQVVSDEFGDVDFGDVYELVPGMVVEITDGTYTRGTTIQDYDYSPDPAVDPGVNVDVEAGTVSGFAEVGSEVCAEVSDTGDLVCIIVAGEPGEIGQWVIPVTLTYESNVILTIIFDFTVHEQEIPADPPPDLEIVYPTEPVDGIDTEFSFDVIDYVTNPDCTLNLQLTVEWGDETPPYVDLEVEPFSTIVLTHTFPKVGTYTVTVTVVEPCSGFELNQAFDVFIENTPPTITSLTGPIDPVPIGTATTINGEFVDPNWLDKHTMSVDWGDGSVYPPVTVVGAFTVSHTYAETGVYRVTATVADDETGSDIEQYAFVVVYDPIGGFVTGAGAIDSPAGAYAPEPLLDGEASFEVFSKYKKGASVPIGETEFAFEAGDMRFLSAEYDWLVVAGAKAQLKGTGTINGSGEFGFMLTAVDAKLTPSTEVDLFRIKIWDKATGYVVYDNQMGEVEDASPATEITSGNIVVHKAKKAKKAKKVK